MPDTNQTGQVKVFLGKSDTSINLTPDISGSFSLGGALNVIRLRRTTGTGLLGLTADVAGMRLNLTTTLRMTTANKILLTTRDKWFVWIEDSNSDRVVCFPAVITARPISSSTSGVLNFSLNAIQTDEGAVEGPLYTSGSRRTSTGIIGYQRISATNISPVTTTGVTASAANPVVTGPEYKAAN